MTDERWEDLNEYQRAAAGLLVSAGITVSKHRSGMSGVARGDRTIETPEPKGPISFAILAHEVGHVVLGHHSQRKPRWQEEVEAWEFALNCVERFKLKGYDRVVEKAARSISVSFYRAIRRGVPRSLIEETYPTWWEKSNPGPVFRKGRLA